MNPLERTDSTAPCRRCGHIHWNDGDVCAACIREADSKKKLKGVDCE